MTSNTGDSVVNFLFLNYENLIQESKLVLSGFSHFFPGGRNLLEGGALNDVFRTIFLLLIFFLS